jgi:hypothetical protein
MTRLGAAATQAGVSRRPASWSAREPRLEHRRDLSEDSHGVRHSRGCRTRLDGMRGPRRDRRVGSAAEARGDGGSELRHRGRRNNSSRARCVSRRRAGEHRAATRALCDAPGPKSGVHFRLHGRRVRGRDVRPPPHGNPGQRSEQPAGARGRRDRRVLDKRRNLRWQGPKVPRTLSPGSRHEVREDGVQQQPHGGGVGPSTSS